MSDINPSKPNVDGISKVEHDGMDDAGHEEQADRGNGETIKKEDNHEGSPESTKEEKSAEDDED